MTLKVTEEMLIKARYELEQFQPDDETYEIIYTLIMDGSLDEYTKGYLMAKLDEWSESLWEKELLKQFIDYVEVILALND